jgi:hypothetical protein
MSVEIRVIGSEEEVADVLFRLSLDWELSDERRYPARDGRLRVYVKADVPVLEDVEIPDDLHGGHMGQWIDVDGEQVHVLADPNMDEKTANAIAELVRAVRKLTPDQLEAIRKRQEDGYLLTNADTAGGDDGPQD